MSDRGLETGQRTAGGAHIRRVVGQQFGRSRSVSVSTGTLRASRRGAKALIDKATVKQALAEVEGETVA